MNEIIKNIEAAQLKDSIAEFHVGDTVRVHAKIKEGNRERVQVFEGVVLKRQGGSSRETFTVIQQFIDDFLTQIIGHMPGETFDVVVTFPDPYENNPDYSGKEAVFEVTINYIEGESVVPEFDDAFVSEILFYYFGWETVEDARAEIEQVLYEDNLTNFVWDYILENTQITEVPQAVEDFYTVLLMNRLRSEAEMYGITAEQYLQMALGVSDMDTFLELQAEYIEESAEQWRIIQAVAEDIGFTADDATIVDYFLEEMGTEDYSDYEESYGRPYICWVITSEHIGNLLIENAVIG